MKAVPFSIFLIFHFKGALIAPLKFNSFFTVAVPVIRFSNFLPDLPAPPLSPGN